MRKTAFFISLLVLAVMPRLNAQQSVVRGKITFITLEYVYTSLGRINHLRDSMTVVVFSNTDTIAFLRVDALSSKSSACSIISSKKKPVVGDSVFAEVTAAQNDSDSGKPAGPAPAAQSDQGDQTGTLQKKSDAAPGWLKLQGRVSAQYFTLMFADRTLDQKMPGVSMNLLGTFTGSPLTIQMSGNFRSLIRDASVIAPGQSPNQTQIYSAALNYNDGVNAFSFGRVIPPFSPFIGSVDGGYASHTIGQLTFGLSGGFDSYHIPGAAFTDQKKFALFAGFQTSDHRTMLGSVSYSRSYFQTSLIREVVGGMFNYMPSDGIFFNAQSEFDLRTKLNDQLAMKEKLTSLFANVNVAVVPGLSLGVGVSSWRPTYYFPSIQQVADNLIDLQLRTTPTFSINCSLIHGVYLMNTYSPRTSDLGFGREYMNNSSLRFSDFLGSGILWGASYTLNTTDVSDIRGYSITAQRELFRGTELDFRYDANRYTMQTFNQVTDMQNIAGNLMVQIIQSMSFILGVDHSSGDTNPFISVYTELTYRF